MPPRLFGVHPPYSTVTKDICDCVGALPMYTPAQKPGVVEPLAVNRIGEAAVPFAISVPCPGQPTTQFAPALAFTVTPAAIVRVGGVPNVVTAPVIEWGTL